MQASKLGEIIVKHLGLSPKVMVKPLEEHIKTKKSLTEVVIQHGITSEAQILEALETYFKLPGVNPTQFEISDNVLKMIPFDLCQKHLLIPLQVVNIMKMQQSLVVAFSDPSNLMLREDLRFIAKAKIQPVVATETSILQALAKNFGGTNSASLSDGEINTSLTDAQGDEVNLITSQEVVDMGAEMDEGHPIVKFVNAVLGEAVKKRASDIHIEVYEKRLRVRLRVDGRLIEIAQQPAGASPTLSSRIKIMAKLDISERRRPQDGRIRVRFRDREIDFRVSVLPTLYGEKIVLRLLDKSSLQLDLNRMGFEPDDLNLFRKAIHEPQGLVLITGPTGSGKTTTIYSALTELNQPDVNISTAEDPVEYNIEGINQLQVNTDIDLSFSSALRAFLRQDPDIILVGEIRDLETAEIAFKAASTGHMVVSTLHTNDAPQSITRLAEMGIAPYLIGSTLTMVVSQRLIGRICENCKTVTPVTQDTLIKIGVAPEDLGSFRTIYKGQGCDHCNQTGIRGRVAIFEVLPMAPVIKEAVLKGVNANELRWIARREGMRTLRQSALLKLRDGATSIEEVINSSVSDSVDLKKSA